MGEGPDNTGSIGAGIVIDEGVTVRVGPAEKTEILIRRFDRRGSVVEERTGSGPIERLLSALGVSASVRTACRLPIGAGFGLSAAALVATAVAVNRLQGLGLSTKECYAYAHSAEVRSGTGLGDVAACQEGGRDCRMGPGVNAPIRRWYDMPGAIAAVSFGPLPTPGVLRSREAMDHVKEAFPAGSPETPDDFFRMSREFTGASGFLTDEIGEALARCDRAGVPASMTMLGRGVFAWGIRAGEILSSFGEVYSVKVAGEGARILGVEP